MSYSDRRQYLTATTLTQALLDNCQDNLDNGIEMVCDIETPVSTLYVSDANMYVGNTFYEALTKLPTIKRSIGEWLSPELEFSTLNITVSNVDGRFNNLMPSGGDYDSFVGKNIDVKVGLRDVSATYFNVFSGRITDIGGVQRSRESITFIARDSFDKVSVQFPTLVFTAANFADIDDDLIGKVVPVIYGDWTINLKTTKLIPNDSASPVATVPLVPAYPVNGKNAGVLAGTTALTCYISAHALISFDNTEVFLKRGENHYKFATADITHVSEQRVFTIKQISSGGATTIDGALYQYAVGDSFLVRCKGKDLGSYDDNIVEQAKDILKTYGGLVDGDFHANWATYRAKNTPAQSNIAGFKSRVWIQEPQSVISYALSMLEQVRLEAFFDKDKKIKLNSLHFEDFIHNSSHVIRNWDVEASTFSPKIDEQNLWNRARATYLFEPASGKYIRETPIYKNQASITQLDKAISKLIEYPNLFIFADVEYQVKEKIKLASAGSEMIEVTLTPRSLLQELGGFVLLNINFGATVMTGVPAMIREVSYNPEGFKLPVRLWSMQLVNFPNWTPAYNGIVGGYDATITQE